MSYQKRYASFLAREYKERSSRNPKYSLRAFAKHAGLDQSLLSKVLKGNAQLSPELILKTLMNLDTPESVRKEFESRFKVIHASPEDIETSMLEVLADWRYWALLEYVKISPDLTKSRFRELLKISKSDFTKMLNRLERHGFISIEDQMVQLRKPNNTWISNQNTTAARKVLQKSFLELSLAALKNIPFEERWHSSLTVAIDSKNIPKLKKVLHAFQNEFDIKAQKDDSYDSVYQLTVSFYPLLKD